MSLARCCGRLWVTLPLVLLRWPGLLLAAERVALVEVFLEQRPAVSAVLQGEVVESGGGGGGESRVDRDELEGELLLVDEETQVSAGKGEDDTKEQELWIGLVPLEVEDNKASTGNQESFADAMVNKMKRALVLGASALIILALNQNTVREMDLSPVLSKPIIVIQTSENVTKLIGALLRGLQATAKITYKTILQDNLGATLTLWSSCGRSRGGRYGEWQGLICTGETNSQVQKYLQQLWDTVLLVALILSTGVIVQARRQNQDHQRNDDVEVNCSVTSQGYAVVLHWQQHVFVIFARLFLFFMFVYLLRRFTQILFEVHFSFCSVKLQLNNVLFFSFLHHCKSDYQ
uniref:RING-type E3 ubiquitin transferase n=1 Tax=Gasterosteus aculeatus aculeatus TaxID=481459 RepID=A0AAQ4R366_GASAC